MKVFVSFSFFLLSSILIVACQVADTGVVCPSKSTELTTGSWYVAQRIDSANGGYGSVGYAPNGDLYVFYSVTGSPEPLKVKIRRAATNTWTSEISVSSNARTSNVYFASSSEVYVGLMNSGTASLYS